MLCKKKSFLLKCENDIFVFRGPLKFFWDLKIRENIVLASIPKVTAHNYYSITKIHSKNKSKSNYWSFIKI